MNVERAKEILEENKRNGGVMKNRLLRGLQILAKHYGNLDGSYDYKHDTIRVGGFEKSVKNMTEAEVAEMSQIGWFYDNENNSWQHF